jgi:uncharacterized protein
VFLIADACPVKDEAVRMAERHGLAIHRMSDAFMTTRLWRALPWVHRRETLASLPHAIDESWRPELAGDEDVG